MKGAFNHPALSRGRKNATGKDEALRLIHSQRTMVLATARSDEPWAAPVYYVYDAPGFFFFSSPRARHIEAGTAVQCCAAAIFADSDQWEKIEGLQMTGAIQPVQKRSAKIKASARFILKFPFAEAFLQSGKQATDNSTPPGVGDRVKLYVFVPTVIYYVNNRIGFGKRMQISI